MADSAKMRHAMPIFPRYGSFQARGLSGSGVAIVLIRSIPSLIAAVRVFWVLQIPQWPAARDCGERSKVVDRGRRTYGPFKSPGIPGIVSRFGSFEVRNNHVRDEHKRRNPLDECSDSYTTVQRVPTPPA